MYSDSELSVFLEGCVFPGLEVQSEPETHGADLTAVCDPLILSSASVSFNGAQRNV